MHKWLLVGGVTHILLSVFHSNKALLSSFHHPFKSFPTIKAICASEIDGSA